MAFFLVENLEAKTTYDTRALVVQAESAADAKVVASAHLKGDSTWAGSTATALTATTLDSDASMLGWKFDITIAGGAGQSVDPITVTHTGTGTDDIDAVAADLVTALNGTEIDNAAYSAPNLTIATGSGGDDLGDATVTVVVTPASGGSSQADLEAVGALLVGTITHEGSATDALAVALVADTEATPLVSAAVKMQ